MQILKPENYNALSVQRFNYPANRNCIALYQGDGQNTQNIGDNSQTVVDYPTKVTDAYAAVTTGAAWKFTCPAGKAGWFNIESMITYDSGAWAASRSFYLIATVSGYNIRLLGGGYTDAAITRFLRNFGATTVYLDEDEYIQIGAYQNSGGTRAILSDPTGTWIAITRTA